MDSPKNQSKFHSKYPLEEFYPSESEQHKPSATPPVVDPHIGSFIKDPKDASEIDTTSVLTSPGMEAYEKDEDPEERRDKTLSLVFTMIGALVLIAAVAFYIKIYVQPAKTDRVSELFVDVSDKIESGASAREPLGDPEEINRQYKENLERLRAVSTSSGELFMSSALKSDVDTEQVVRATSTTRGTTTPRTDVLSEVVTSNSLGITFLKDPYWKQMTSGNSITFKQVGPESKDVIFMTKFHGASVTTEDSMNGSVIYFYHPEEKTWMSVEYTGKIENQGTITPKAFVPTRFTKDKKPIFQGTSRTKTFIVALGTEDFIIVNISGTGYSKILDTFVSGISSIKK